MGIADRLFGRGGKKPARPMLALPVLLRWYTDAVPRFVGKSIEPDLVCARIGDACRDANIDPVVPEDFDDAAKGLHEPGWQRLALAASALDLPAMRKVLPQLAGDCGPAMALVTGLTGHARQTPLLTLDLLWQSAFRIEEFARGLLARLEIGVAGENDEQAAQRLERLDYARLLAEAENARVSAEDRMEYIRRLQEEEEKRRPRRGKW
jgi:hypothetical protein